MALIIDYKWMLLIVLEVLAWLSTFFMFYARYGLQSKILFKLGAFLTILTGVIPHLTLMVMSIIETKSVGLFEFVVIGLLIYILTFGKKKLKQMDQSVQAWVAKRKQSQKSH